THTDIGQGIRAEALARCMKSLSCVLKQQAHPLPTSLEVDLQEPFPRLTPRPPLEQVLERRPPAASLSLQDLLKECLGKPDAETTVEPAQLEAIAARLDGYLCDPGERLDLGDIGIDALDEFVCMGLWRCFTEHLGTATPRGPSHIVMPAGVEGPPACLDAKALPRLSVLELPDFGGDSLDLLHLPSLSLVVFSGEAPEFEKDQLRLPS